MPLRADTPYIVVEIPNHSPDLKFYEPADQPQPCLIWIMLQCMGLVLGHKAGLHGMDIEMLHKLRKRKKPYYVQTSSDRVQNGLTFIKFRGRHEFDRFCEQGLVSRTWTLFKSIQVCVIW